MKFYQRIKDAVRHWLQLNLPACCETTAVISESMERALTIRERLLLKLHLKVCVWCKWYMEQVLSIRKTLRTEPVDLESLPGLADDARARLKKKING